MPLPRWSTSCTLTSRRRRICTVGLEKLWVCAILFQWARARGVRRSESRRMKSELLPCISGVFVNKGSSKHTSPSTPWPSPQKRGGCCAPRHQCRDPRPCRSWRSSTLKRPLLAHLEHLVDGRHHGGQVVHSLPVLGNRLVAELAVILIHQRVVDLRGETHLSHYDSHQCTTEGATRG